MAQVQQVHTTHLLIKHTGSRNPVSRRTNQKITLSKADAIDELKSFEEKLLATPEKSQERAALFQKFAKERSDCGSFQNSGSLGMFSRGQMQKPFEDASFALEINGMSSIVDTDSGVHLILRLE